MISLRSFITDVLLKKQRAAPALLLMIAFAAFHNSNALGDDARVRALFLREYEHHAAGLQDKYCNFRAKFKTTLGSVAGPNHVRVFQGKYNAGNYILEPVKGAAGMDTVEGRNSQYNFLLTSKGAGRYVLKDVTIHQDGEVTAPCFLTFPFADYQNSKLTFTAMAGNREIQFLEFDACVWQGKPAKKLRIKLTIRYGTKLEKSAQVLAVFYFSPDEGWICRGMQAHNADYPSLMREEVYEYEQSQAEGYPIPKRVEVWLRDSKDPAKSARQDVTDITEFERCAPFADSEFTLSAFGLPEPMGVTWPKPTRWWLWISLLAVAALSLAGAFQIARRRYQSANPGKEGPSTEPVKLSLRK